MDNESNIRDKIDGAYEKLKLLFRSPSFDEAYEVSFLRPDKLLVYSQRTPEQRCLFSTSAASKLEICSFARQLYDHIRSREHDHEQNMFVALLWEGIDVLQKNGQISHIFLTAHHRARKAGYAFLIHSPDELFELSGQELDIIKQELFRKSHPTTPAEAMICITGIQNLRKAALDAGLDIFKYTRDSYYTEKISTYQFRCDLEAAVEYELLTQII